MTEAADTTALASFHDLEPVVEDFRDAVIAGLSASPKSIPCKFLYDEHGSRLFERICELDEYYLTRTEIGILDSAAAEIAELVGPRAQLIEFGSGSSRKVRILLGALKSPAAYMPIDISREHLLASAETLARDHPGLEVAPVCADYTAALELPALSGGAAARKVGFFPGSSIGNFAPERAEAFLAGVARMLGTDGGLLIGVDLKKDRAILEAAYDDRDGVTAAFNLNLLRRINRELDANFDLGAFRHRAVYNETLGRIEIYLVSTREQTARVAGRRIDFAEGESIHTENSYKFEMDQFLELAAGAGFAPGRCWTDPARLFSLHYLTVA